MTIVLFFRPHWQSQEFYSLEKVVKELDSALLDYEKTVAVAAGEGINLTTKQCTYQWTYVQSVFFTSTIITTVGEFANSVEAKFG